MSEVDKIRDAISDIIANHLEIQVDDYRAADEIIRMLRPELFETTPNEYKKAKEACE